MSNSGDATAAACSGSSWRTKDKPSGAAPRPSPSTNGSQGHGVVQPRTEQQDHGEQARAEKTRDGTASRNGHPESLITPPRETTHKHGIHRRSDPRGFLKDIHLKRMFRDPPKQKTGKKTDEVQGAHPKPRRPETEHEDRQSQAGREQLTWKFLNSEAKMTATGTSTPRGRTKQLCSVQTNGWDH